MVLEYLDRLAQVKGLACDTVKVYLTAITRRHAKVKVGHQRLKLTELDSVQQWLRGLTLTYPMDRPIVPEWSLSLVLSVLKQPPYYNKKLSLVELKYLTQRTVFLIALTTARRASEIHALTCRNIVYSGDRAQLHLDPKFLPKVNSQFHVSQPVYVPSSCKAADKELRKLCVMTSLKAYISATKRQRAACRVDQLFVAYGNNMLGQPVKKNRISTWMRELIQDCYKRQGLPVPGCSGHQVRKMATSWANLGGVDPELIRNAATWSSSDMLLSIMV